MPALDRLERLTDLVLVLLNTHQPLTLDEIAREVPGYPESRDARRQAFERDKRLLREDGVPVLAEPIEGPEQFGYRIEPEAFYLPDLGLQPDEQAALHLAVAGVHLGDPSGRQALLKLGASGAAEGLPLASLAPPAALVPLFDAVRSHAEVSFTYRGDERRVAPGSLHFRGGRWYLVGWDRGRDASRTFRVDRIEGDPVPGDPGSGTTPVEFDAATVPADAARPGVGEAGEVLLVVDPVEAGRVTDEVGEPAVVERRPDGSVLLRLEVANEMLFRSWVLGLLEHAVVVGPEHVREDMVAWLDATADPTGGRGGAGVDADQGGSRETAPRQPPAAGPSITSAIVPAATEAEGRPSPRQAGVRLSRLLAIVGWLAKVGKSPISEVAARFSIPEDEVVRELELAACCGLPPYSPDVLLEIVVTDDTVEAFLPEALARPRRLTPQEGLALATSARTILAVPGADEEGALQRALTKLDTTLGDHQRLVVDLDEPPLLKAVRDATDDGAQLEIQYHSGSTDETTTRVVDPVRVVSLEGHWYLDADCHRAGGLRRFRVDRIQSAARTGALSAGGDELRDPESARPLDVAFVPGPGAREVSLALHAEASWVIDTLPVLEAARDDAGEWRVVLAVGGRAWLERLLLQLGPTARVVAPSDLLDAGPAAARRVLGRYHDVATRDAGPAAR